ncbi:hypothetical protein [Rufibacter aurantiacus]|uniref:hypothetical protein n=1 Tax=Rufibacter aurantiacus TaxID=2817374 RepID=UPI001B30F4F3|nr:hypothetical protein [Rufibacter aurantiacus]
MKINAKSLFVFTLGLTYSTLGFSQTNAPQGMAAQMNLNTLAAGGNAANVRIFDNRYEGVKGSPYFMEAWLPGEIEIKAGNTGKTELFKDLNLKYDVFSNLLVAVIPQTKDTLQISTLPVISFRMEAPAGDKLEFRRIKEARELDPALADAFFAVLYDSQNGKATVVKRIAKKKIEANFKGPYSAGQTYDEIVDETSYYVVANGKMKKVKLNKKSLLEAFPEKADQIKSFISSQKLAMSSEADLVKAVTYYQSI